MKIAGEASVNDFWTLGKRPGCFSYFHPKKFLFIYAGLNWVFLLLTTERITSQKFSQAGNQ